MSRKYEQGQILYRAEADTDGITYDEYKVIKPTMCGAWIQQHPHKKKWIGNSTKFAWPTKEEASKSLLIRSRRYLKHCVEDLHYAEERYFAVMMNGSEDEEKARKVRDRIKEIKADSMIQPPPKLFFE